MDCGREDRSNRHDVALTESFSPEPVIWVTLALASCASTAVEQGDSTTLWLKVICLLGLPLMDFFSLAARRRDTIEDRLWRQPRASSIHLDPQGTLMSSILVPGLLSAMSMRQDSNLAWMSLSVTCLVFHFERSLSGQLNGMVRVALATWSFASQRMRFDSKLLGFAILLRATYHSIRFAPALHGVFTRGEWTLVSYFSASILFFWCRTEYPSSESNLHNHMALVGLSSCLAACCIVGLFSQPLVLKVAFLILFPIASTEFFLMVRGPPLFFPRSLVWILSFLLQTEEPMISLADSRWLPEHELWPRYYWLVHWIVVLFFTMTPAVIYCNVSSMEDANRGQEVTIVARKWFHLVAVALFVPVTLFAPKLQSLSYAIALAALMVLEAIRSHVPSVNAFYARYVDRDKQEREDSVLVSHMALVVGCAAPLWIAEYCSSNDETLNSTVRTVLSLWGVLCLGIGDAAGAVVGVYFGRHYWSALNRRTIEGSLAMLASMSLPCWLFVDDWKVWVPAVLFTTLLEAWTIQLDNLVLPLVGSTIILLCQPSRV